MRITLQLSKTLLVFLLFLAQSSLAQESYWQPEFVSSHNIKSISKFKDASSESEKELILKIDYDFSGKELQRWQKEDDAIYLTINEYDPEGRLQKSTRLYQNLELGHATLDTTQFSEFFYSNDSMQERISWTPDQPKSEARHYLFSLKKITELRNRNYFGEPTYNAEGALVADHWGFQQTEVSGCIISTTGDLYHRQFNYNKFGQKVSETWFKNEKFFRSISYFKDYQGKPLYEVITEFDLKNIKTKSYSYVIE
jgi:hypothetical protein